MKSGFSLIEVLFAIILVGIAIAAMVAANISFTKASAAGTDLSTAEFLIEQIKELTTLLLVIDPETGLPVEKKEPYEVEVVTDYCIIRDVDSGVERRLVKKEKDK